VLLTVVNRQLTLGMEYSGVTDNIIQVFSHNIIQVFSVSFFK
jgi:hypothetical protein